MNPKRIAPPGKGGAHDSFGDWSRFADTPATVLAQPPALARLIALHLGRKALAGSASQ
jgi:hypothetical protein